MTVIKKPKWFFYPTWIILTMLCVPLTYLLGVVVIRVVVLSLGDIIYVNGVRHITEDYLFVYIAVPILGLLTGLLQYGLLRRYMARMGWWVLTTTGGWIVGPLLLQAGGIFLKPHDTFGAIVVFSGMGLSIGVGQWLLLRQHLPRAGWWVGANMAGWALLGLFTGSNLNELGFLIIGLLPACVTAATLAMLMRLVHPAEAQRFA